MTYIDKIHYYYNSKKGQHLKKRVKLKNPLKSYLFFALGYTALTVMVIEILTNLNVFKGFHLKISTFHIKVLKDLLFVSNQVTQYFSC